MRSKGTLYVLLSGILVIWAGFLGYRWLWIEGTPQQFTLESGSLREECVTLYPDQKLVINYQSTTPIRFDLHTHQGEEVQFHIYEEATSHGQQIFQPVEKNHYCLLWENNTPNQTSLSYQIQRQPADPEAEKIRHEVFYRVAAEDPQRLEVVDLAGERVFSAFLFADQIFNFTLSPQSDYLAVLLRGELQLVDVESGTTLRRLHLEEVPRFLALDETSRFLALANEHESRVTVLDLQELKRQVLELPDLPLALLPDDQGNRFLVRTEQEVLRLQFEPLVLEERQARIPLLIGEDVQLVDPNAWCFVHGVPHPLFAPVPPAMSETGLPGSWWQHLDPLVTQTELQ